MFKVYYINHQFYAPYEFNTFVGAVEFGKGRGFEFRVEDDKGNILAAWSPINGLNLHTEVL